MAGLVFVKTKILDQIVDFYIKVIGCTKWLSQPDIEIIKHENFIIGFHKSDEYDSAGLLTFFYKSKSEVDQIYQTISKMNLATSEPKENLKYKIYNFFAKDIEGRKIEFQTFLHELPPI